MKEWNVWTFATIIGIFALGYAFAILNTKMMTPAAVAQIGSNQEVVKQVNISYQNLIKELNAVLDKRLGKQK